MNQFTLDCRQLDQWDYAAQPPVPVRSRVQTRPAPPTELAALKAAISLGKSVSSIFSTLEEIVDLASKPVTATILTPGKMPVRPGLPSIKFSASNQLTGSFALAASVSSILGPLGVLGSMGIYASTTREVGVFATLGGGIFFNTPSGSAGLEISLILGTPADFSGPYFGISVGAGNTAALTVTLLFAPTPVPPALPTVLTLMGLSVNVSATTPTKLPLTVSIEVTNTRISGVKF